MRGPSWAILLVAWALLGLGYPGGASWAQNIDPEGDGSKYAYAENVGWLNGAPLSPGGPGVQVADFELTGWMWGENIGWISLSCENSSTCVTSDYRVRNDGDGTLSGFAWGESVGWIRFDTASSAVNINSATGEFSGAAWSENLGWISFASSGQYPYRMKTGWRCVPAPEIPPGGSVLSLEQHGPDTSLSWTDVPGSSGFDLLHGDLTALRNEIDPFTTSTLGCVSEKQSGLSTEFAGIPAPGEGFWFLIRGANCGGNGTYDDQRDAAIGSSGNDCG